MDISDFVKKAKEYNVLGIKISKDNENAEGIFILQQRVSHPVQLALLFRKG